MTLRPAALLLATLALATILGAWAFQLVGGLPPCPLCLDQRLPYYLGVPLALAAAILVPVRPAAARVLLAGFGIAMLATAGLAIYHVGIEWHWWEGPGGCSGGVADVSDATNLLGQLNQAQVVRCDEAAWRLFGISLAGFNALIGLALAAGALLAAARPQGSSSVSQ